MSSSPFELFRRNLKPMMVFLTLLALVSFVILPSVAMYQQQNMGGGGSTTLATYKGGDFDFAKVNYFTRNHYATVQFLSQLAETTIARGGTPKVAEFQYDTQRNAIQSLGINENPSDRASIRTLMFANEAKKAGLELDDTAVRNWLTLYTDGRLSDSEINGILSRSTRNTLGQVQLYEQLRTQLLARTYQQTAMGGLTAGGTPIVPPAQLWELFLRLNRQATADAYAVNIADFVAKTNATPSEAQIKQVYDEGKEVFPTDQSPKPAFRRPYEANIEYLAGNLEEFIQREIATLTEEQLRAEYQRRLEGGDFKLPEQTAPATDAATPEAPAAPAEAATSTAAGDAAPADAPATEMQAKPTDSALADAAPAADTAKPEAAPAADAAKPETPPASEPAPDGTSFRQPAANGVRLVTMQADAPAAAPDTPAEQADAPEKPAAAAGDAPSADTAQPADEKPADKPADEKPADKPADEKPADEKPADEKPADKPADEKPADSAAANPAMAADQAAPATPATPAVEPFEKVRDDIARSLAMQPALTKLDAAITEADKAMRSYFNARAIAGGKADKVPAAPDLKALADKLGMKHVVTGLQDGLEIQEDPIALSFGVGTMMQRGPGFVQTMYASNPVTPLFTPVRTVDDQAQVSYVSWKTEDRKEYVPELKEVRDEVIATIRNAEARKLAKNEADRLAKEFNSSDKPIKELIPADRQSMLFEGLGPFSWMNSFGFGMRAFLGNVPELDQVGEAFMRQVFTSDRNRWGVAPNMPETVFYVVRPTEFTPSTDELHKRFAQASQRLQTTSLAVEEAIKIRDGFYEALDKRTGFNWNEEALAEE